MAKDLKNTIVIEGEEYNINAVRSATADRTEAPLFLKAARINVDTGEEYAEEAEFKGDVANTISYVPADEFGGKFAGPVFINNLDLTKLPTEVANQAIINYGQINSKIADLTGAPLFTLDANHQIHKLTATNKTDYKLNTLIGTSFNFESIKRILANPNGSNGIKYEALIKDDDAKTYTCKVIGLDDIFDDYVVIPPTFKGTLVMNAGETTVDVTRTWTVTEIAKQAFSGKAVKSVILPNSIEVIGSQAFENCAELVSINIPDKVIMIGNATFRYCTKLKNLKLGTGITKIDSSAFAQCSSLESVIIPEKVTAIKSLAFNGSKNLASVVIPSSVTELGEQIFDATSNPVNLTIYYTGTAEQWTNLLATNTRTNKRINAETTTVIYNHKISNDIPVSGEIVGYTEFIDNPILYICKDTETASTPVSNKMFLKLPGSTEFVEVSKGAARLESPTGATTQGYYTYETLAAIIAGINSRLTALGSTALALPESLKVSNAEYTLVPDLPDEIITANNNVLVEETAVATVQQLQEQITAITGGNYTDKTFKEDGTVETDYIDTVLKTKADEDSRNIKYGYYRTADTVVNTNIKEISNTISIVNKVPTNGENGTEETPGAIGDIMIVINA